MRQSIVILFVLIFCSCTNPKQLINNSKRLTKIENDFNNRKEKLKDKDIWSIFNTKMTISERQAMEFLYAYMPISDLADYNGNFFLRNVKYALKTKTEFSWGAKIPETEFLYFVLPHRINNENLDSSRVVFFNMLKNRVKGLNIYDAAQEINHWCHEKVTYHPADIRTSGPLATLRTAKGRCGEESTFTTQALRSVGIPARQVYTPRWAHSNDNHAWVEVFVNNKWSFLGACEPSAKLNQGWFVEPTRRAMLIHTKAFGDYSGNEKILKKEKYFTELNTLKTYAVTKSITIKVVDENNKPLNNAEVDFGLYNYAEFYPLTIKHTNAKGECEFLTGLGDLLVWASDGNDYGFKKVTVADDDEFTIIVTKANNNGKSFSFDLVPPLEKTPLLISKDGVDKNNVLLKKEDSIRTAYESTFMTNIQAEELASKVGLDKKDIVDIIKRSFGNYSNIEKFIVEASKINKQFVIRYCNLIANKDLRDTEYEILISDFKHSFKYADVKNSEFAQYVLDPRVRNELLTNYKEIFQNDFSEKDISGFKNNTQLLVDYVKQNIKIDEDAQYYDMPTLPTGVQKLKITNEKSRDVYFVALCRSFGIPSRLNIGNETVQINKDNIWKDIYFGAKHLKTKKATVSFITKNKGKDSEPRYYIDFSLSKIDKGLHKTLEFGWSEKASEFNKNISVDAGNYMLVTGSRMNDGSVLSKVTFFEVKEGEHKNLNVDVRKSKNKIKVLGKINLDKSLSTVNKKSINIKTLSNNKGLVLLWLDPDREPTKHLMKDLERLKSTFEKNNLVTLTITPKENITHSFKPENYKISSKTYFAVTSDNKLLKETLAEIKKSFKTVSYPVVMCMNNKNEIVLFSQGYRIGLGEIIIKTMN